MRKIQEKRLASHVIPQGYPILAVALDHSGKVYIGFVVAWTAHVDVLDELDTHAEALVVPCAGDIGGELLRARQADVLTLHLDLESAREMAEKFRETYR